MRKTLLSLALCLVASGCYLKQYPVTPEVAETATYILHANDTYQGTAWAVNEHTLITAGHMCRASEDNYVAVSSTGRSFRAHTVVWEESANGLYDMCELKTDASLSNWLIIADRMPKIGEQVWYDGWPDGKWVKETGVYLGDMDGPDAHWNDNNFSAPIDHGASGSALFTKRGVWGIVVRIRTDIAGKLATDWDLNFHDGSDGGSAIDLDKIKAFLDEENVKYDTTPITSPEFIPTPGLG